MPAKTDSPIDVLVLCALKEEYDALLEVSADIQGSGWAEQANAQGWLTSEASFLTAKTGALRIRASYSSTMGREHTLALANQLLAEQPVRCLAMTGICAGRRDKVMLGDVIFADRLYSCDVGKTTVENGTHKFEADPLQYHPTAVWKQRMLATTVPDAAWMQTRPSHTHEYQEEWVLRCRLNNLEPTQQPDFATHCPDWADVLKRLWRREWLSKPMELTETGRAHAAELQLLYPHQPPESGKFQIHVGPIATGASVIEDAERFSALALSMRKILGLDMEASALGVAGEFANLPVVVVKGVSDYGDPFKDDRYRVFAARAAAECLIAFFKSASDLLVPPPANFDKPGNARPAPGIPSDLITFLADAYSDLSSIQSVWQRAGGRAGEIENIRHPQDLWLRLWTRCTQGAAVRPSDLLNAVLADYPANLMVVNYLQIWAGQ